jgi:hypothetical protein
MSVPKHLAEAVAKLKEASFRIDEARRGSVTCENQKVWLEALTVRWRSRLTNSW